MKRFFTFLLSILLVGTISSHGESKDQFAVKYYTIEEIRGIKAGYFFEIQITKGNSNKMEISAPKETVECVIVEKKNGVLFLDIDWSKAPSRKKISFSTKNTMSNGKKILYGPISVKMELTTLESITLSGASKITTIGTFEANEIECKLSGASSIKNFETKAKRADIRLSGASSLLLSGNYEILNLTISGTSKFNNSGNLKEGTIFISGASSTELSGIMDANRIKVELSGASKIKFEGKANSLELKGSGAISANLKELIVQEGEINLSGASKAYLNVQERLKAHLSGFSNIEYNFTGKEENLSIDKSGKSRAKKF